MSLVAISGNASGTGTLTIAAPNTNSNFTLTLPTETTTLVGTNATQTLTNKTIQGGAITSGTAVASTSGTSIDFTGIPSWVKRVTVMFQGLSSNSTSFIIVQLGTGSTTYTTSGYLGAVNSGNSITNQTTGFGVIGQPASANVIHGSATITNITNNSWVYAGTTYLSNTGLGGGGAGSVSLGAALTAVRITTVNGTDTFDAGSINILYEG
jgi:hypothetical protein